MELTVQEALLKGIEAHKEGKLQDAERFYRAILQADPKHPDANHNLGVLAAGVGKAEESLPFFKKALEENPKQVQFWASYFNALIQGEQHEEARQLLKRGKESGLASGLLEEFEVILNNDKYSFAPASFSPSQEEIDVLISSYKKGDWSTAEERARALTKRYPVISLGWKALGASLSAMGQIERALDPMRQAITLDPSDAEAHNNLGGTLIELGRLEDAEAICREAIRLKPDYAEAHYNLALTLHGIGKYASAASSYLMAAQLRPNFYAAFNNAGDAFHKLGRFEDALKNFKEAIKIKPDYAEAFNNQGNLFFHLKQHEQAIESLIKAINLKANFPEAFNNLGNVFADLRSYGKAISSYDEAIRLNPNFLVAHKNLGHCYLSIGKLNEAFERFDAILRLEPEYEFLVGDAALICNRMCLWDVSKKLYKRIADGFLHHKILASPFSLLSLCDEPEFHKIASSTWNERECQHPQLLSPSTIPKPSGKIHLIYLSSTFHEHAMSYLLAELFELHDRNGFELTAISFGPDRGGPMRDRIKNSFDRFIDVRNQSDIEVARYCREIGADIAVDLNGYTQDSRPGILAKRCAPIQINWLGYPGTMAAPFIDYIVADPILITQEDLQYYSEKVIWLPDTYQINDTNRVISDRSLTRFEFGLPEQGFVFCCFNNSHKILPETFNIWMRLLKKVPKSVLWLIKDNPTAVKNLQQEAQKRGVDPSRLIFAERVPLGEHLARHRLADLFIDTWPYNAHTTASDALWAGLPLVTRSGKSFASRVAASLLNAVGLEELIARDNETYEELICLLALHPYRLAAIREKLAANRFIYPLFNPNRFTQHLERAYRKVIERHWRGERPEHLYIEVI